MVHRSRESAEWCCIQSKNWSTLWHNEPLRGGRRDGETEALRFDLHRRRNAAFAAFWRTARDAGARYFCVVETSLCPARA